MAVIEMPGMLRSMKWIARHRGVIAAQVIRVHRHLIAAACGVLSCLVVVAFAAPALAAPARRSVKVVQVVQLPTRVDRRVLSDLASRLDTSGAAGTVVVEVLTPATLADDAVAELAGIAEASTHGSLVVLLDDEHGGGSAGAILFALASLRLGEPQAAAAAHRRFIMAAARLGPACDRRCAQVLHGRDTSASFQVAYPTLSAFLAAQRTHPEIVPAGVLAGPAPAAERFPWWIVLVALLSAGAAAGWYMALRRKRNSRRDPGRSRVVRRARARVQMPGTERSPGHALRDPGGARPVVPALATTADPQTRVGRVRTELHPQGYVELDGCLYRATWAEPGERNPGPGESVRVASDRVLGLVAFPVASADGPSSPSVLADPG